MPVYDYKCTRCGHRFDLLRGLSSRDDEVKCPKCEGGVVRVYEGRWSVGKRAGGECSGNCQGCPGCGR